MRVETNARRILPRGAARPASGFDDGERRARLSQSAAEFRDFAARIVEELLAEAVNDSLTLEERRGLVAIALEVDRQAAARIGAPARTVEILAAARAGGVALQRDEA